MPPASDFEDEVWDEDANPSEDARRPVEERTEAEEDLAEEADTRLDSAIKRDRFAVGEYLVVLQHGVGKLVAIETTELNGMRLGLLVISFKSQQMTLRVPENKASVIGISKLADEIDWRHYRRERGPPKYLSRLE